MRLDPVLGPGQFYSNSSQADQLPAGHSGWPDVTWGVVLGVRFSAILAVLSCY